jgi:hypothetical protein
VSYRHHGKGEPLFATPARTTDGLGGFALYGGPASGSVAEIEGRANASVTEGGLGGSPAGIGAGGDRTGNSTEALMPGGEGTITVEQLRRNVAAANRVGGMGGLLASFGPTPGVTYETRKVGDSIEVYARPIEPPRAPGTMTQEEIKRRCDQMWQATPEVTTQAGTLVGSFPTDQVEAAGFADGAVRIYHRSQDDRTRVHDYQPAGSHMTALARQQRINDQFWKGRSPWQS